jgi:hypothetical protein
MIAGLTFHKKAMNQLAPETLSSTLTGSMPAVVLPNSMSRIPIVLPLAELPFKLGE